MPVHCVSPEMNGYGSRLRRALRRLGRDGDCPAPREDSISAKKTSGINQRSAGIWKYLNPEHSGSFSHAPMQCRSQARAKSKRIAPALQFAWGTRLGPLQDRTACTAVYWTPRALRVDHRSRSQSATVLTAAGSARSSTRLQGSKSRSDCSALA